MSKRRYLELGFVILVVALCAAWLRPKVEKVHRSNEQPTVCDVIPSPVDTVSQVSINGAALGMTYQEVTDVLGPSIGYIPPHGKLPKVVSFGQEARPDNLGYADFTEVGFDEQRKVIYVAGFRLFVDGQMLEVTADGMGDPRNAELLTRIFGREGLTQLDLGKMVVNPGLSLEASPPGKSPLQPMLFRLGERP